MCAGNTNAKHSPRFSLDIHGISSLLEQVYISPGRTPIMATFTFEFLPVCAREIPTRNTPHALAWTYTESLPCSNRSIYHPDAHRSWPPSPLNSYLYVRGKYQRETLPTL